MGIFVRLDADGDLRPGYYGCAGVVFWLSSGQLPFSRFIARVHPTLGTPIFATLLQVAIAIIMMAVTNPDYLSEMAIFAIYIFYILAFIAIFILRRRNPGTARVYSVPLYPVIPLVAIGGSLFVVISTLTNQFYDCLWAILITLLGLPLYLIMNRRSGEGKLPASSS
ncbi:MAG: steT [Paenibacillaceae bacterium]|jgi:APA family basic amino acid/polyamine antiporter|nr:steT [Paenibacillaceae bacterium]